MTLPSNFGRAIDLSALGKPAVAPKVIAGKQVSAANFADDFLAASRTKPVILACWSAKSPESVKVVEVLSALQNNDGDRWIFGTVNVDVEAQLTQALQVRAVPYAVALVAEQLVPLFEQNYPEAQIRMVVDKVLSIAAEQGIGASVEAQLEPEEEEAHAALESGDFHGAEAAFKKLLARKPQDTYAKLGLAQTQLLLRTSVLDAKTVVINAEAQPDNLDLQIQCADLEIARGDVEAAFNRLLRCIRTCRGSDQDRVKSHLLELFTLVDPADSRLVKARSALASALF
jgi:putative thioredoxin